MLWLTDIHVDFKNKETVDRFFDSIASEKARGICITGDMADKEQSISFLEELSKKVDFPIYFVLGNHDYYGSSILSFQKKIESFFEGNPSVVYLPSQEEIGVSDTTAIIGIDNWYDLEIGNYFKSEVRLRDFTEIADFMILEKHQLYDHFQKGSRNTIFQVKRKLEKAFENYAHVILLAHVPPFIEACLYKNKPADEEHAPFFIQGLLGSFLLEFMEGYREKSLTVLSGHTHHKAFYQPLPNLVVKVGFCPDDDIEYERINLDN